MLLLLLLPASAFWLAPAVHAGPITGPLAPPVLAEDLSLTPKLSSALQSPAEDFAFGVPTSGGRLERTAASLTQHIDNGLLAVQLLPRSSRWLLSARTQKDEPLCDRSILPPPREMGMAARSAFRPFELIQGPDHATAAWLFASGMILFCLSTVIGTCRKSSRDPVLPPRPAANRPPLLPVLISRPECRLPSNPSP